MALHLQRAEHSWVSALQQLPQLIQRLADLHSHTRPKAWSARGRGGPGNWVQLPGPWLH